MTKLLRSKLVLASAAAVVLLLLSRDIQAAPTIFDDFNVNEGHFTSVPTASGSTVGITAASTADRVTTSPVEGAGCERLVIVTNNTGAAIRLRFLSGGGTVANNTAITTSAGMDGWIGCYVKTTNAGWNVQLWLEGGGNGLPQATTNNGSISKDLISDGQWHLYEWDLDNTAGDANGWGPVANIIAGSATVIDGSHTLDSIIFRSTNSAGVPDQTGVIFVDFVARNDAGSVSNLLLNPCINTTGVVVSGPVSTNVNSVTISGVSASATVVNVYQNTGPSGAMVLIGSKTTGITAGDNAVTVTGLVKDAQVVATQTVSGQESCVPAAATGVLVGGGANPSVRLALSIRQTSSTGPVGEPGDTSSANIHFVGATTVAGGAPADAPVVYPSNGWQTVTFLRGTNASVGFASTITGTVTNGPGYLANDAVSVQVWGYQDLPSGRVFSIIPATSTDQTSNDVFSVNWSWDAISDASGYRLVRQVNLAGYNEFIDIPAPLTNYTDLNTGWTIGNTTTPSSLQYGRSVQWNPSVTSVNNLPGQWGILEALSFAIHNLDDTGPFDLYVDNIQNGTNVFQTFETAPAHSADYAFRQPSFSGTTSGSILAAPNVGEVSNLAADTGTKSFHVRFQWSGTNVSKWLRLTTAGVNNPQVNLDEPISVRLLLKPVNSAAPVPPPAPTLTIDEFDSATVLNWTGGHRLLASTNVLGTYSNISPTLSSSVWTNITLGAFLAPYTNNSTAPIRFFRLVD